MFESVLTNKDVPLAGMQYSESANCTTCVQHTELRYQNMKTMLYIETLSNISNPKHHNKGSTVTPQQAKCKTAKSSLIGSKHSFLYGVDYNLAS